MRSARPTRPVQRPKNAPKVTDSDGIEAAEKSLLDEVTQSRVAHLHESEAIQREHELAVLREVTAEFVAAEREAGHDQSKLHAIRLRRERAAMIARQLNELEEERQSIHARTETRNALEARLRVAAAQARCEELQRLVESAPMDGARSLTHQRQMLERQADELEMHGEDVRTVLQLDMATEHERWSGARQMVEALEDEIEAFRIGLAKTLSDVVDRDAKKRAKRAAAEKAARARLAPLTKECEALEREVADARDSLGARGQQAAALEDEARRVQARLSAEAAEVKAEVAALTAREKELLFAVEADREAREAAAAAMEQQLAAAEQQQQQQQLLLQPHERAPLQPAQPPPPRKAAAASAPATASAATAIPASRTAKQPVGSKLDLSQRARLDALKGKYGDGVAKKLAASDRARQGQGGSG